MVIEDLEEPEVKLDYFGGASGTYTGFDRFDRIIDQRWYEYGASEDRDRFKYGYDRVSNRTWKENTVSKTLATSVYLDEFYTYDGVNRLTNMDRGELNNQKSQIVNPKSSEDWTLDPLGNWSNYVQKTSGTTDLDQERTVNKANEITDITETTGPSWPTPSHDRAGNMISIPHPDDLANDFDLTWDAWNRLVEVEDDATTIAAYIYDGLMRRILKDVPGSPDSYQDILYNSAWQVLECRVSSTSEVPSSAQYQYIWSVRYIDACVLRDDIAADPDVRLYYLGDANFNITTLIDTTGTELERYIYDPHGDLTIDDGNWSFPRSVSQYENECTFSGRRRDRETVLHYFRNRAYDAALGKFVSRDGALYASGVNLYAPYFVPNYTDPYGLQRSGETDTHFVKIEKYAPREIVPESERGLWREFWRQWRLKMGKPEPEKLEDIPIPMPPFKPLPIPPVPIPEPDIKPIPTKPKFDIKPPSPSKGLPPFKPEDFSPRPRPKRPKGTQSCRC